MKLKTALALAVVWLNATDSYSQPQLARSAQNEQTEPEAAKHRLRRLLEQDPNNKLCSGLGG